MRYYVEFRILVVFTCVPTCGDNTVLFLFGEE